MLVWQTTYYAGYKRISTADGLFDSFPIAIWHPTNKPSKQEYFGPFKLTISLGAKIAKGKFPLAMISHGSGGIILGHRDTAQYLAEHGYVVVAISHPKNNVRDNSDEATTKNWINRPKCLVPNSYGVYYKGHL